MKRKSGIRLSALRKKMMSEIGKERAKKGEIKRDSDGQFASKNTSGVIKVKRAKPVVNKGVADKFDKTLIKGVSNKNASQRDSFAKDLTSKVDGITNLDKKQKIKKYIRETLQHNLNKANPSEETRKISTPKRDKQTISSYLKNTGKVKLYDKEAKGWDIQKVKQPLKRETTDTYDDLSYITSRDELTKLAKGWDDDIRKGTKIADIIYKKEAVSKTKDTLRKMHSSSHIFEIRQKELSETIETYEKEIEFLETKERDNPYNTADPKILKNFGVTVDLYEATTEEEGEIWGTLFGLKDKKDNLQALGIYSEEEDHIYVNFLATSPWNLLQESEKKQKGSGTRAITEMVKISMEKGYDGVIKLYALGDAKDFYSKLGFEFAGLSKKSSVMILTAKNAKKLIEKEKAKKRK